jgi:hypothetical protein
MFYPGVKNRSEAKIITIGESEQKKLGDFKLLPTLKERTFSGVVLSSNGTPIKRAKVYLNEKDFDKCGDFGSIRETKTDEFGRFQLKGYESYEYKIGAYIERSQRNPYGLQSEFVEIPTDGNLENLELIIKNPN